MKKNKLFLCFRHLPIETEHRQLNAASVRRSDNGGSPVLDIENRSTKSSRHLQKSISSRSFSRIIKSILFQASLKERVCYKTGEEPMLVSKSDGSSKISKCSQKLDDEFVKSNLFDIDKKLSRKRSSNSISKLEKYRSESFNSKKQSNYSRSNSLRVGDSSSSYSGLYLILITLCITILCGRVYGILLMSLWVYCTPRRRDFGRRRSENKVGLPETEEEVEYEKRLVIMEGLIERNHHREGIKVLREREFSRV